MKKLTGFALATLLILTVLPMASAGDDDVTVDPFGYMRVRPEFMRNLTDVSSANDDEFGFVSYRARMGINAMLPRDVTVVLDAQVLGRYGETGTAFRGFNGIGMGGADVHLFQGYVDMANIRDSGLSLRFGRTALALGDEWLIGDSEFYGGTSFDAFLMSYGYGDGHTIHGLYAKLAETDLLFTSVSFAGAVGAQPDGAFAFDAGAEDVDVFGLWNTFGLENDQLVDLYLLRLDHRLEQVPDSFGTLFNDTEDRWTLGVRYNRPKGESWDLNVNAGYQFGDINIPFSTEHDIRAYAVEVEAGWTFVRANNLKNRVHIIAATYTGEDDEDDKTDRRFSILFQDRHGRYGMADFYTGVFLPNLVSDVSGMDIYGVGFDAELGERWSVGGKAIGSNVAKNPLTVNPSVAYEGDIYVHLDYNKYLSFDVVWAHVFARSFFIDNPAFGADQNASRIYINAVAEF